ncbi:MAG: GEVED domain-containing protein [Flavobacteriales bacterium]|jgi:hypothetical protein
MKKLFTLWLALFAGTVMVAQSEHQESGVIVSSAFHITRPLTEIFAENPVDESKLIKKESSDRQHREATKFEFTPADGAQYDNDPSTMQTAMGDKPSLGYKANWAGQTAAGFRPYDPSGAVGPNHYIQMINATVFKVYDKNTGTVLLTGTLGNLWSPATGNNGDPIVMYDKAADRWFLAQFGTSTDRKIYIAVSTTNNPLGSYYTYTYVSPQFPDYLKFSVWQDGYYMTSNQSTQKVFCFERTAMLAGTPGARSVYVNYTPPKAGFFVPLPGCAADGTLPPAGTPCPIVSYEDNNWGTAYVDRVNIYNMTVNWTPTTPTATITLASQLPLAAFNSTYNASWNDVSQPGTTQKLDGIGGAMMYRAQWKSWSGYNTMVLNWAVQISTSQRSIKWVELRQNQSTGVWSVYQEGIYTPDANTRWMGSICMDNNGSIGLSYLKSNATNIYPGLYYTGRRTCDPLGTLPVTETLVIAGTGSQTGGNRNGDYAHQCLDTDGVTFWSTSEFMGGTTGTSAARTRIFSYQIAPCSITAGVSIAVTGGSNPTCSGASVTFTATPTNGGSAPVYQWKVNGVNVGTNSATYSSTTLANESVVTCVMTSNLSGVLGSPATSNAITITVSAPSAPSITIAASSNPACAGASVSFTSTVTNGGATPSYAWTVNGAAAGTNSATFSSTTLANGAVVACTLTSSSSCVTSSTAASNSITMTINPSVVPAVSIAITAGTNPSASGASVTFTATPTNGGTTPSYQWKVNGTNVGTNSATYTTTTLTNGAVVTCVMTSNATCAVPASATSAGITMSITGGTTTYCSATTTAANATTSFEYIRKVVCGFSKTSNASTYSNFTTTTTTVVRGATRSFTITVNNNYTTDQVLIWCDWNRDGDFTDAGENVYSSVLGGAYSGSFVIPTTASIGAVRMRIRLTDTASGSNTTPCGVSSYGEVEDYTLNVVAAGIMTDEEDTRADLAATRSNEETVSTESINLNVYPNPNNGNFTVKALNEGTYYLMNEAGQLVKSFTVNADNNFTYQLENLTSGFYVLSGQNKQGISKQKIVVTK